MNTVIHVFHDVYMGYQFGGLTELLKQKTDRETLNKGELAVFINKKWTACKILAPNNVLVYHREPDGQYLTIEDIKRIPTAIAGKILTFGGATETHMMRDFERKLGKLMRGLENVGK